MNITFPHPVYQNLPPNKLTKGPSSFQKSMLNSPDLNVPTNQKNEQDLTKKNTTNIDEQLSLSSSSSGDLIEKQFQEYQKVIHNPTKAIRDEYTLTTKLKKKDKKHPLKKKLISKNIIEASGQIQPSNISESPQKKLTIHSERSHSSLSKTNNQPLCSSRIPDGHISSLSSRFPLAPNSSSPIYENKRSSMSNFNSKSIHDPFNTSYIHNLDSNLDLNKKNPHLNITGQSLVGASISHVRPQKIATFEEKQYSNLDTRINWIQFRANPVKKTKPYAPPISKEDQYLNHLMSEEGLKEARKKSEALDLLRKQKRESQKIPDYANHILCPSNEMTQTQQKVKVISKTMAINDF